MRGVDPGGGIVYMKIQRNESVLGKLKIDGYDCMSLYEDIQRRLRGGHGDRGPVLLSFVCHGQEHRLSHKSTMGSLKKFKPGFIFIF